MGAGSTMTDSKLWGLEVMSHLAANQMTNVHGTARMDTKTKTQREHLIFPQETIIFGNTGAGKQSDRLIEVERRRTTTYTENLHKSLLSNSLSFPSSGKIEECEPSNSRTSHQSQQIREINRHGVRVTNIWENMWKYTVHHVIRGGRQDIHTK